MAHPIALVILAAGASRRLGRCKALAPLGDDPPATPLGLLLAAGAALGDARPLVIGGKDHAALARALPQGVELAHNRRWAEGRTGSILLARDLRPGRDLCLAPVDVPLVPEAVFRLLAEAWDQAGCPPRGWLSPQAPPARATSPPGTDEAPGRTGHPVIVGRELLSAWKPASASVSLRKLRHRADPLWTQPVPTRRILDDLDTPADLERLRTQFRS